MGVFIRISFFLFFQLELIYMRDITLNHDILHKIDRIRRDTFDPFDEDDFFILKNLPKETVLRIKDCNENKNILFLPQDIYVFFAYGFHGLLKFESKEYICESIFKSLIYSECFDRFLQYDFTDFKISYFYSSKNQEKNKPVIKEKYKIQDFFSRKIFQNANNENKQYPFEKFKIDCKSGKDDFPLSFSSSLCEFLIHIIDYYSIKVSDKNKNHLVFSKELRPKKKKIIEIELEKIESKIIFREFSMVNAIISEDFCLINSEFKYFMLDFDEIILTIDQAFFNEYQKYNTIHHTFIRSFYLFVDEIIKNKIRLIIQCGNLLKKHTGSGFVEIDGYDWIGDARLAYIHYILFDSLSNSIEFCIKNNTIFKDIFDLITPNANKKTSDENNKDEICDLKKIIKISKTIIVDIENNLRIKQNKNNTFIIDQNNFLYFLKKFYQNLSEILVRKKRSVSFFCTLFDMVNNIRNINNHESDFIIQSNEENLLISFFRYFKKHGKNKFKTLDIEEGELDKLITILNSIIFRRSRENYLSYTEIILPKNIYTKDQWKYLIPCYNQIIIKKIPKKSLFKVLPRILIQGKNPNIECPFYLFGAYYGFNERIDASNIIAYSLDVDYHNCYSAYFLIYKDFVYLSGNKDIFDRFFNTYYPDNFDFFENAYFKRNNCKPMIHLKKIKHLYVNLDGNIVAESKINQYLTTGSEMNIYSRFNINNIIFVNMDCKLLDTSFFSGNYKFSFCEIRSGNNMEKIVFKNNLLMELKIIDNSIIHDSLEIFNNKKILVVNFENVVLKKKMTIYFFHNLLRIELSSCTGTFKIEDLEFNNRQNSALSNCMFFKNNVEIRIENYCIRGKIDFFQKYEYFKLKRCLFSVDITLYCNFILITECIGHFSLNIKIGEITEEILNFKEIQFLKGSMFYLNFKMFENYFVFKRLIFKKSPEEFIIKNMNERCKVLDCYKINEKNEIIALNFI